MLYVTLKVIHVLAIICWMAGLLYLPRLYVYHSGVPKGSPTSETFKTMERRLLQYIMNPAMITAWITGLWIAYEAGFFKAGWLHAKLLLVILMSAAHGVMAKNRRLFAADANVRSDAYFRVLNEVPTVLMIFIVILVIAKPF